MIDLRRRRIEPRVGQVDASILDSELLSLLKDQLWSAFKTYRPEIKDKYESELVLLLKVALFKLTVWDHSATYGAKLQNLKFVDARSRFNKDISLAQKVGYGVMVVGGSYLWEKLEEALARASYSGDRQRTDTMRSLTDTLSTAWSVSSLANFVLFLFSGKYSTLVLRLLKIRLVPTTRLVNRQVNFEFQNRQLVWNALTEFLLFILPLLNLPKLKRTAVRFLAGSKKSKETEGELAFLPEKTCAVCYKQDATNDAVTNPYQADCGHVYCYVCIQSKLGENENDGWHCLRCGSLIKAAQAFQDVDNAAVLQTEKSDGSATNEKAVQGGKPSPEKEHGSGYNEGDDNDNDDDDDNDGEEAEEEEEAEEDDDDDDDEGEGPGFIIHDEY